MTAMNKKIAPITMFLAAIMFVAACGGIASQNPSDTPRTDSQPDNGTNNGSQPTSEASQQGYLMETTQEASFIKWTEAAGNINGQLQTIYVSGTNPPQTESETVGFTGILEGSELTVTISILGASETWTGTLEGDALTLMIPSNEGILEPYTFEAATVEDYNRAASKLREPRTCEEIYGAEAEFCDY